MALDAASGHLVGTENACPSIQQVEDATCDLDSDDESLPDGTLGVEHPFMPRADSILN